MIPFSGNTLHIFYLRILHGCEKEVQKTRKSTEANLSQIVMSWLKRYQKIQELSQIRNAEGEAIALSNFDRTLAWEIGCCAKSLAEDLGANNFVIDITLESGQILFHAMSGSKIMLDDEEWVRKNCNTAIKRGFSTYILTTYVSKYNKENGILVENTLYNAGGVPIRLKESKSIVGALTIRATRDERDHWVAIETLHRFVQKNQKST